MGCEATPPLGGELPDRARVVIAAFRTPTMAGQSCPVRRPRESNISTEHWLKPSDGIRGANSASHQDWRSERKPSRRRPPVDRNRPDGGGERLPIRCNERPWGMVGDLPRKPPGVQHASDGQGGTWGSMPGHGRNPDRICRDCTSINSRTNGLCRPQSRRDRPERTFAAGSDLCGSAASQQGILWTWSPRGICVA